MRSSTPTPPVWWRPAAGKVLPAVPLVVLLAAYWRIPHFGSQLPGHGDALEYLWAIDWFLDGLRAGDGARLFVPHVFMPEGWSLATFANGLGVFALAVPIAAFSSAAAAFNALVVASFFIAYLGQYRLTRLATGRGAAVLVALLYVLWGGRWVRIQGHLHILIGSALLPWLLFFADRALARGRRGWPWALAAGVVWAVAISFSLYFIWLGLVPVVGWLAGAVAGRRVPLGRAAGRLLLIGLAAVLPAAPYLYLFWRNESESAGFTITQVNLYNLSLDWLPALYPAHPVPALAEFAIWQTGGAANESIYAGFGVLLAALALVGLFARRSRRWAPAAVVAVVGVVLALGPTLHWRGEPVHWPPLRPINEVIWDVGHALKPDIFPEDDAPAVFATAVPLPGLALSAVVPFFEGARVPSRYLLVAAPAVLLLAAVAVERLTRHRRRGALLFMALAALLLVESARRPITGLPAPPPSHPAFDWLAAQPTPHGRSVIDIAPISPHVLSAAIGGDVLVASTLHGRPIVGGGGSVLPLHYTFVREWFFAHPDPVAEAELPALLRAYGVGHVLVHMMPGGPPGLERLSAGSAELQPVDCFGPAAGPPWTYPICILEVVPPAAAIGIHPAEGFSAVEPWGVWATGTEAQARWFATSDERPARFAVEAFPYCVEGQPQSVEFVVGGRALAAHRWEECEPWRGELFIPAELVTLGANDITLRFGRATRPADHTGGHNPDTRPLSVGFARFEKVGE